MSDTNNTNTVFDFADLSKVGSASIRRAKVKTGFRELDALGGLASGGVNVIAGAPDSGLTDFALNLTRGLQESGKVLIFSPAKTREELLRRVMQMVSCANPHLLDDDLGRSFKTVANVASQLNIAIDDSADVTVGEIHDRSLETLALETVPPYIIVDDLQNVLYRTGCSFDESLDDHGATRAMNEFKGLASALNATVIVLSKVDYGMLTLDRDPWYLDADFIAVLKPEEGSATLDVVRNRNGRCGEVDFDIDPDSQIYREIPNEYGFAAKMAETRRGSVKFVMAF